MIGSDGLPHDSQPHPRLWGSFARVLGHYSRDLGLMPLELAVHKMTGLPASRFGLADRGLVREGMAADLVVFEVLRGFASPTEQQRAKAVLLNADGKEVEVDLADFLNVAARIFFGCFHLVIPATGISAGTLIGIAMIEITGQQTTP